MYPALLPVLVRLKSCGSVVVASSALVARGSDAGKAHSVTYDSDGVWK